MGFLAEFRNQFLLNEVSIDQLRHDWVDAGKMSAELFNVLCQCANNQSAYATWLVKRIGDNAPWKSAWEDVIGGDTSELVRNWNEWFDTFTKYKQYFDKKDINQYKTEADINAWVEKCRTVKQEVEEKKRQKDVDKFKIGAVQCDGKVYLVYKLPKGHPENHQISVELGKTDHEALGRTGWCTASGNHPEYWNDYIKREDLYVFVNPQDKKFDKYQIQFGYFDGRAFPVTTDQPESEENTIKHKPFYDFLHEKEGRPYPPAIQRLLVYDNILEKAKDFNLDSVEPFYENSEGIMYNLSGSDTDSWGPVIIKHVISNEALNSTDEATKDECRKTCKRWIDSLQQSRVRLFSVLKNGNDPEAWYVQPGNQRNTLRSNNIIGTNISRETFDFILEMGREKGIRIDPEIAFRFAPTYTAEQAKKGTLDKATVYIFPEGVNGCDAVNQLLGAGFIGERTYATMTGVAVLDLGDTKIFVKDIYGDKGGYGDFVVVKNGNSNSESHNPDVYYSWWKTIKHFDEYVEFPDKIQKIDNIKTGGLREYEIQPIGQFTKIYEIPRDRANELIPYYMDYVRDPMYLCFIGKWQVTLCSGYFTLIGRHGQSNSVSWIQSVKGLGESLKALCDREELEYPLTLREWWHKYKGGSMERGNTEQPAPHH